MLEDPPSVHSVLNEKDKASAEDRSVNIQVPNKDSEESISKDKVKEEEQLRIEQEERLRKAQEEEQRKKIEEEQAISF
jgi:hypothetical protein